MKEEIRHVDIRLTDVLMTELELARDTLTLIVNKFTENNNLEGVNFAAFKLKELNQTIYAINKLRQREDTYI